MVTRRQFMKGAVAGLAAIVLDSVLPSIPPELSPFSSTKLFAKDKSYEEQINEVKDKLTKDVLKLLKEYQKKGTYYECRQAVSRLSEAGILAANDDITSIIKECEKATPVALSPAVRKGFAIDYQNDIVKKYTKEFVNLVKKLPEGYKNELLEKVLVLDEDNEDARKMRNEKKVRGYGWLKSDIAKHYEKGEREVDGKWVPKQQADEIHKDWKKPWVLKGKHFEIRTNTSEEEAISMLEQAEEAYSAIETELGRVLELNKLKEPIVINYYDKIVDYARNIPEEFQKHGWVGQIGFRNGKVIYLRKQKDSDDTVDVPVQMRSVISAYFLENIVKNANLRKTTIPNLWAGEGFCSLAEIEPETICPGVYDIAKLHKGWLDYYKNMTENKFKPLKEIIAVYSPTEDIQAQGWGLSHYFFNAENGKYRYKFIELLGKVCRQEAKEEDFEKILGVKPDENFNKVVIKYIKSLN